MRRVIAINPDKCVGCRNCALACSFTNGQAFCLARSRIGTVWVPDVNANVPMLCQHCADPLCVDVCPVAALSRDESTGAVVLARELCIGCRMCTVVCPFGGLIVDPDTAEVAKCDLCGGDPQCVKHCVYGALEYIPVDDLVFRKRQAGIAQLCAALNKLSCP